MNTEATPEQRLLKARLLIEKWNTLVRTLQDLEGGALALMRHPEATPEMILLVAQKYRETYASMESAEHRVFAAVGRAYHYRLIPLTRRSK